MKVRSYLNDVPFDELSYKEKLKFSRESQIKMLKIAGYAPIECKTKRKRLNWIYTKDKIYLFFAIYLNLKTQ